MVLRLVQNRVFGLDSMGASAHELGQKAVAFRLGRSELTVGCDDLQHGLEKQLTVFVRNVEGTTSSGAGCPPASDRHSPSSSRSSL